MQPDRRETQDSSLLERIAEAALRQGLRGPAVARAEPPSGAGEALSSWLAADRHGEMEYMARRGAARADPTAWAGWARSVALFADAYDAPACSMRGDRGAISRYARGDDYHDVLRRKLERLCTVLRDAGRQALPFVDSSPLMEKALAAAGGLGWIGKNGNLLLEQGSFFFLGGLATDAVWPLSPPVPDGCGSCNACIPACPTGAIVEPGIIDARLCISYLTIELKGAIPEPLRQAMGNRIFGCDDCQDVCPVNTAAGPGDRENPAAAAGGPAGGDPAYRARSGLDEPDLLELARLDEAQFRTRFKGTPVRRARFRGFLRNVMVALGNWGAPEALEGLRRGFESDEALVRGHAAWGIGQVGTPAAREMLAEKRAQETDAAVRREIERALTRLQES